MAAELQTNPVAEPPVIHEEHLQKLAGFCETLGKALIRVGLKSNQIPDLFRLGLAAECVNCGIHVSGEELYALSLPPSEERASTKIGRLRLGDCARRGCDSYFYRVTFYPSAGVNWAGVFREVENLPTEQTEPRSIQENARAALINLARSPLARRVAVTATVIMVLVIARQFYLGGRVPFLREPEHFRVDQEPAGEDAR